MVRFYNNGAEVGIDAKDKDPITFPITEIGSSSTLSIIVENDSEEFIELIPYVNDKDVQIQDYPQKLGPREKGNATWIFTPKPERLQEERRSLRTTCGFKEIVG